MLQLLLAAAVAATPVPDVPRAINGQIIDTHTIWQIEFVKTERPIKFVFYPTSEALNAEYNKLHPGFGTTIAFSEPWKGDVCEVHIVDPRVEYQAAVIGHEIMHCIFGSWHFPFGAPPLTSKK